MTPWQRHGESVMGPSICRPPREKTGSVAEDNDRTKGQRGRHVKARDEHGALPWRAAGGVVKGEIVLESIGRT